MKTSNYLSLSISIGLLMSLASCQKEEMLIPSGPGKIGATQVVGSKSKNISVSSNLGSASSAAVISKDNTDSESGNIGSPDLGDISKLKSNSESATGGTKGSSVQWSDKNDIFGAGVYKVKRRKDLASAL